MSNTTNHFASGFNSSFPNQDLNNGRSRTALIQNLIRKAVEQAEWLVTMKEKDIYQLVDDKVQIEGADQISDDKLVVICARYGAARGGMHATDVAADRIDERMDNLDQEIEMLNVYIKAQKEAYQECTGDTFTPKPKQQAPKVASINAKRKKALADKYMRQAAE